MAPKNTTAGDSFVFTVTKKQGGPKTPDSGRRAAHRRRELKHDMVAINLQSARQNPGVPRDRPSKKIQYKTGTNEARLLTSLHGRLFHGVPGHHPPSPKNRTAIATALRSIRCKVVFLLSGTPFYNRWTDIFGQLSLLPRCPFKSINHSRELFASSTQNKLALKLLIRLLSGLLVSRPKSILSLPPVVTEDIEVDMPIH